MNISRVEQIMNEITVLEHLPQTKYIPSFIEYYLDDINNKLYIVTELVKNNIVLDTYIETHKYDKPAMFKISRQICEVLHILHNSNICHGDFFTKNIMICPTTLNIKIIDFGAGYYFNDPNFITHYNKKEGVRKNKVSVKKRLVEEDLVFLGMTIYTLFTYGDNIERAYMELKNHCGIGTLFENKDITYLVVNAFHLSDEFDKISKEKKYTYYKPLSTLLQPYYKILKSAF